MRGRGGLARGLVDLLESVHALARARVDVVHQVHCEYMSESRATKKCQKLKQKFTVLLGSARCMT